MEASKTGYVSGVSKVPVRIKQASLPWIYLASACCSACLLITFYCSFRRQDGKLHGNSIRHPQKLVEKLQCNLELVHDKNEERRQHRQLQEAKQQGNPDQGRTWSPASLAEVWKHCGLLSEFVQTPAQLSADSRQSCHSRAGLVILTQFSVEDLL